jgi:hypothetical protein
LRWVAALSQAEDELWFQHKGWRRMNNLTTAQHMKKNGFSRMKVRP